MKDEIISGIQNAMLRGESLEKAAQSFINAGYNPQEVRAAVSALSEGVSAVADTPTAEGEEIKKEEAKTFTHEAPANPHPQEMVKSDKPKRDGSTTLIIGAIILFILIFLGVLGYLVYYLLQ